MPGTAELLLAGTAKVAAVAYQPNAIRWEPVALRCPPSLLYPGYIRWYVWPPLMNVYSVPAGSWASISAMSNRSVPCDEQKDRTAALYWFRKIFSESVEVVRGMVM